jgi:VCBS repeat-containing protein
MSTSFPIGPVKGQFTYIPDQDNAVFEGHIRDGAVTADKLGADVSISGTVDDVTLEINGDGDFAIKDGGVDTAQLADDAVATVNILDENVTDAKLTTVTQALLALIAAIPTVDPEDGITCWFDSGVLKVATAP